jgi:NADH dehydrogenase
MSELHVVTGAFGYSGKYITLRLLEAGRRVRTLTNSLQRTTLWQKVRRIHSTSISRPR